MESTDRHPHTLEVRLLSELKKYSPASDRIGVIGNETVSDIILRLGIKRELVRTAFLDGRFIEFDTEIKGARKLLLLPAIGGG